MKIKFYLPVALLLMVVFTSCGKGSGEPFKSAVTGRNGEVLVVINDNVRNDTAGHYIHNMLSEPYRGLSTPEPIFDCHMVPHGYFDDPMHNFRNIIIVNVSDTLSADTVYLYNDLWAKGQSVVWLRAKTKESLLPLVERNKGLIVNNFVRCERERLIAFNKTIRHHQLSENIGDKYGVNICIPNTYIRCTPKDKSALDWVAVENDEYQMSFLMYEYPYTGPFAMTKAALLNKRDSLLRANIEGPQGSFMCTETRFGLDEIDMRAGRYKGSYVAEIRGLWRMEGYAMGGPFIMRAMVDSVNSRVVVTDGFVYYPSRDKKRNLIRQLEAIMYSVSLKTKSSDN
ncbi:MAG: DUF4837 family protein [Bacteroidales bacterium]|jgi:hypothetical protein|nr:DUF4837 family protein [Bacteroidales bacterium]